MGKGAVVLQGVGEGAVEGAGEGVGVASLLVKEQDASAPFRGGRGWAGQLRSEPCCCGLNALKSMAAVNMPADVSFAANLAAARPTHFLQTTNEFGGKR